MALNALGIASSVFLALYAILFFSLLYGFATRQLKLKSRWSFILFHVTLRLAAQSVGIAFAIIGYANTGLLIAYLVLAAEGYFSLVLCTARFLVSFQTHAFGDSWMEPKAHRKLPLRQRLAAAFVFSQRGRRRLLGNRAEDVRANPMVVVHYLLIGANTIIITGGSLLSGALDTSTGELVDSQAYHSGKAMRAAGQAIFLAINLVLVGCILVSMRQYRDRARRNGFDTPRYGHPFLLVILAVSPFLVVRGVFGICQAIIDSLGYYSPETYDPNGLATDFVIKETVLAVLMEWSTCALLCLTWPIVKSHGWGTDQTLPDGESAKRRVDDGAPAGVQNGLAKQSA